MEELMREIIQVLEKDSGSSIFAAVSAIATLATAIISFSVMIYTISRDKELIVEERKDRLLNSQSSYPLLIFHFDNKTEEFTFGRCVPEDVLCSIHEFEGKRFYCISIDNGILKKSGKPFCSLFFSLVNESNAIIKSVRLVKIHVQTPTKLENNSLECEYRTFSSGHNSEMSNTLLLNKKGIHCCLQLFLDSEDYLPFFSDDSISIVLQIALETINGLTFYQSIVYTGNTSDVDYYYSENLHDEAPLPKKVTMTNY